MSVCLRVATCTDRGVVELYEWALAMTCSTVLLWQRKVYSLVTFQVSDFYGYHGVRNA